MQERRELAGVLAGELVGVRLDKWLWAARFFKTRSLAVSAVEGGKVHIGGNKAKPGRTLRVGEWLTIRRGEERLTVQVLALSEQRGSATVAAVLYAESEESRLAREQAAQERRLGGVIQPVAGGRPTKRARRQWEEHGGGERAW
jgi:ribosome-associated heat shock protein Hsp15